MRAIALPCCAILCALGAAGCQNPAPAQLPPAPTCLDGLMLCHGLCIDTVADPQNCGTCDNACGSGLECISSSCSCPMGLLMCGSDCIDPLRTSAHCGATDDCQGANAGTVCASDQVCLSGSCACPASWVVCDGSCIDPGASQDHCGASGQCVAPDAGLQCADDQLCQDGSCVCMQGRILCGDTCADPLSNSLHCGATTDCLGDHAGAACPQGSTCRNGACTCPGSNVFCDGACIDPSVTDAFCGASGSCTGTHVGMSCKAPEKCLDGACANLDPSLSSLAVDSGMLSPAFDPGTTEYTVALDFGVRSLQVTAVLANDQARLAIAGAFTPSGVASPSLPVQPDGSDIDVVVTAPGDATRTYVIHARPPHITYLKAENPSFTQEFGYSVAISGETVVVGAPAENGTSSGVDGDPGEQGLEHSGAVYLFAPGDGGVLQESYIKASDPQLHAEFGYSVAISGDTMAIGAPDAISFEGAVYVFTRTAGVWTQQAILQASNADIGDFFGISVSLSGDTLAVGAFAEASGVAGIDGNPYDNTLPTSGAAYVFTRTAGTWSQQAYVKPDAVHGGQQFGAAVAVSGDLLAVGALDGVVHLFSRTAGVWAEEQSLVRDDETIDVYPSFGMALSLSGATLAVGASGSSTSIKDETLAEGMLSESGAVWIFTRAAGVWKEEAYLKASNPDPKDGFGTSVSLSGDDLLVGAVGEASNAAGVGGDQADNSLQSSGAAYRFVRDTGMWKQAAYVKALRPGYGDNFGFSIGIDAGRYVVGAFDESGGASGVDGDLSQPAQPGSGAAYVY